MKILIVVDANIIMSALLGGKPSIILFDSRFQFISSRFTIEEIYKYLPRLTAKTGLLQEELEVMIGELPLKIFQREFYQDKIGEAESLIGVIDKKDVDILALALKFNAYLWSEDKHFEKAGYAKLAKTYNFL